MWLDKQGVQGVHAKVCINEIAEDDKCLVCTRRVASPIYVVYVMSLNVTCMMRRDEENPKLSCSHHVITWLASGALQRLTTHAVLLGLCFWKGLVSGGLG